MAEVGGTIKWILDTDSSKFEAGVKSASNSLKDLKPSIDKSIDASKEFTKAFLAASAAVGAVAIGVGVKAVKAFQESEKAVAQLDAVLLSTKGGAGITRDEILKLSSSMQRMTGISDEAVTGAQSMLLTFTNLKKDIFPDATKAVANLATAMSGGAIPSMDTMRQTSIQVGKALNDPILGVTALRRVGIQLSESQTKSIKKFVEMNDIASAQKIILAELETQFGGSAEAIGKTFAGRVAIAKQSWGDFMELVGAKIVKVISPLLDRLLDWVDRMGGVEGIMAALEAKIISFSTWVKEHQLLITILAGAIAGPLTLAFIAWGIAATKAAIATFIALLPVMLIGGGVAAIAFLIIKNWEKVSGFFRNIWQWIMTNWPLLLGILLGPFGLAAVLIIRNWETIKGFFAGMVQFISNVLSGVTKAITAPFEEAFGIIKNSINSVKGFLNKLNPFARFSPSLVDQVSKGTRVIADLYKDAFADIKTEAMKFNNISGEIGAQFDRQRF